MGLFTRKTPDQKAAEIEAKARQEAERAGVDIDGALAVGHHLAPEGNGFAWRTLVIRPDRVELHHHGQVATLSKEGRGVRTIPVEKITSVKSENDDGINEVTIYASGDDLTFRAKQEQGPRLAATVAELIHQQA